MAIENSIDNFTESAAVEFGRLPPALTEITGDFAVLVHQLLAKTAG
jgi:hypothetical protein